MAPEVLYRVCYGNTKPTAFQKSLLTIQPAVLHGYSRHRVKLCDYPAIIPVKQMPASAASAANTCSNIVPQSRVPGKKEPSESPKSPVKSNVEFFGPQPLADASVRGTYVSGLTDGDLWRLDVFEGDEYERSFVDVQPLVNIGRADGTGNVEGEPVLVQTYVWVSSRSRLEDREWDFDDFVKTKMARWVDRGEEYEGESYAVSCLDVRPSI